jgi:hypothetical protein
MSRPGPGASPRRDDHSPPQRVGGRPRPAAVGSAVLGALRDPVIVVFLLAGTFDVLSGDRVVDGVALFGVAVGLGWGARPPPVALDAGRPAGEHQAEQAPRAPTDPGRVSRVLANLRPSPAVVLGGLVYAALVAGFARYSWPATIAVEAPAATAVAVVWRRPVEDQSGPKRLSRAGAVAWGSVLVALGLWELSALLLQPSLTTDSYVHPTISVLMDPLLAGHLGRSVFLWLWLTSGWYLLGLVPAATQHGEAR